MWTMDKMQQDVQDWKDYKTICIAKIKEIQSYRL